MDVGDRGMGKAPLKKFVSRLRRDKNINQWFKHVFSGRGPSVGKKVWGSLGLGEVSEERLAKDGTYKGS